jgi:hypothetical protein
MTLKEIKASLSAEKGLEVDFEPPSQLSQQPPDKVKAVPDLEPHLTALEELFSPNAPPKRRIRP